MNENFGPSLSISHNNHPFVSLGALSTNNNFDPVHGQTQNQQKSQESVGFNPNEDLAPETNQVAAKFPRDDEEDWFNLTNEKQEEAFRRLLEMGPGDF